MLRPMLAVAKTLQAPASPPTRQIPKAVVRTNEAGTDDRNRNDENETHMSITLYGIPNCDTVKRARSWLDDHGLAYAFHDYKKAGAAPAKLQMWCQAFGWERVLNRSGTTFKKLLEADKTALDEAKAIQLMVGQPSMIKRPVAEYSGGILIGFKPDEWEAAFGGV